METVNRSRVVLPLGKDRSKGIIGLSFLCSHPGWSNRQLCILYIDSIVSHKIQCYGSEKNQKILSGASTNYNCHYNIQVKTGTPSECISSPLYCHCQNHVELMKILIDSLVWLLVWKIIIKIFARLWSNPFFGSSPSVARWTCDICCILHAKWRPWAGLWCWERWIIRPC